MIPAAPPLQLGCVLAGGKSSRMGQDKALLPLQGRPLIEHAVERLRGIGCEVVIAGSRPDLATYAPVLSDLHPGCGPLGGIEAALTAAPPSSSVLFCPVDLPLLPAAFLRLLIERAECTGALATVPFLGGFPQPLCAVYSAALLPGISAALAAGDYKVMRVVRAIAPVREQDFFPVEACMVARGDLLDQEREPLYRWFANLNTPAELAALHRRTFIKSKSGCDAFSVSGAPGWCGEGSL